MGKGTQNILKKSNCTEVHSLNQFGETEETFSFLIFHVANQF